MAVRERPRVAVLRYHRYDYDLHANTTGVYGYRAECPCSWKGERRQVIGSAKRDLRDHRKEQHA